MKTVILTGHNFNTYAMTLAKRLKAANFEFAVIVCTDLKDIKQGIIDKLKRRNAIEYIGSHISGSLTSLSKELGFKVYFSGNVNSEKTLGILKEMAPDVAVQAGVGIIRKETLSMFKTGVLNAHMGFLPQYRGMNVLEWSLFNNDPIGITVHFIDEGIDTGDILFKKDIPIGKGDTINSLRARAGSLSEDLIFEALCRIRDNLFERIKQDKKVGKQYFIMHPRLRAVTEKRLQAKEL